MENIEFNFGTDGWRGVIGKDVTNKNMATVAQAFADYLLQNTHKIISPRVAIGYDGRLYSPTFAKLFARVLAGNGIKVVLSEKICPTPVLSYAVVDGKFDAGVMITASHNPSEYNGVKFKGSYGGSFFTEETANVELQLGQNLVQTEDGFSLSNFESNYIKALDNLVDFKVIRKKGIKVLIDSMGGAAASFIGNILKSNGIESKSIFSEPDTQFYGRNPEPVEANLAPLIEELSSDHDFSFGVATDGDADRMGVVLDTGEYLSAQELILIFAHYFTTNNLYPGNIAKTSSVTDKLLKLPLADRNVIDVQVGFKFICEAMLNKNVAIGFEESGGFGISKHIPERDGILFTLILMEILADSGYKKLSNLVDDIRKIYGSIFYDRIDLPYEKEDRLSLLPGLFSNPYKKIAGINVKSTSEFYSSRGIINGLKFRLEGENSWLLIRASETEQLIRFYAEGDDNKTLNSIMEFAKNIIK